ncbi:MAG: DUF1499 domain-containing protein [Hydrogenophaga sp.]|uniref:DUF1499 domain-containing protein n=1 Tax=Hydrogenophaga sp. TaxID=1904254 RepID=UPI0025BA3680|nr:DUF1499 domain-containing protein [Hydrogenophaga sp.]MBT9549368.1 DUF1499 domain-containing protein [Hydrogenophaga sp.]
MKVVKVLVYALLALVVALLAAAQMGMLTGRQPADLGVKQGRLKAPSNTPNSVSSQADLYPDHPQRAEAMIEALPLKHGDASASVQALVTALSSLQGVSIIEQRHDYVHAEAQTPWLKFVDDMEFWVNPERQVIEVRSASRMGRKDFGVNRLRIEALRRTYLADSAAS